MTEKVAIDGKIAELSQLGKFVDEEVSSNLGYSSGYRSNRHGGMDEIDEIIDDFERQVRILDGIFNCGRKFNADDLVRAHLHCPFWVEKFFAQFDWQKIASTYGEAVEKVLTAIASSREFRNYRKDGFEAECLRQHVRTEKMLQGLRRQRKDSDILVVPGQLGLRHAGRSFRRARNCFERCEFGFGSFTVGSILLTHPERLNDDGDLHIDCAGDESSDDEKGVFIGAPVFGFSLGETSFFVRWLSYADDDCGSASGFLPEYIEQ